MVSVTASLYRRRRRYDISLHCSASGTSPGCGVIRIQTTGFVLIYIIYNTKRRAWPAHFDGVIEHYITHVVATYMHAYAKVQIVSYEHAFFHSSLYYCTHPHPVQPSCAYVCVLDRNDRDQPTLSPLVFMIVAPW